MDMFLKLVKYHVHRSTWNWAIHVEKECRGLFHNIDIHHNHGVYDFWLLVTI